MIQNIELISGILFFKYCFLSCIIVVANEWIVFLLL